MLSLPFLSLHTPNFLAVWRIYAFLGCEWLVNRSSFCCCSFILPPWLTESYIPQSCLVWYLIPQDPKLLLRNEYRLFGLSTYQLWNANLRLWLPHIFMFSLSQDCNFKYYLIIFFPWWVQRKQKAVTKMQALNAGGDKKKKKIRLCRSFMRQNQQQMWFLRK